MAGIRSFLVVGAGLVGAAAALRLQAAGFSVTLIDPGEPRRAASFGNAGHIAAEQAEPHASLGTLMRMPGMLFAFGGPVDFRWRDVGLWAPWSLRFLAASHPARFARGVAALTSLMREALPAWRRLAALAGAPQVLRETGHAVVWMSPRRAEAGVAAWRRAKIGATSFRNMSREELGAYAPLLRNIPSAGLRFEGTAQLNDPQAAREALVNAFKARGGAMIAGEVIHVLPSESSTTLELSTGEKIGADAALISAGVWSARLMRQRGVRPPLIAERGYHVQSAEHQWTALPTVFEERALVVTPFSSGLRATSFVEFGAAGAPADPRKWRALQRHLADLGVAFSEAPSRWVGPRPTLPDYLPAIGRLERHPRVFYALGHQHLGLTLSAITAELVEALASDVKPPIALAPFRLERFS